MKRSALILAVALSLPGCATVMNTTRQTVPIRSTPAGARCAIGDQVVTTPGAFQLHRGNNYTVTCRLAGYEPAFSFLAGRVNGWTWCNLITFGPLGLIVDYDNDAAFTLYPEVMDVVFMPRVEQASAQKE